MRTNEGSHRGSAAAPFSRFVVASTATLAGQGPKVPDRPLTIEDQGSFFIGGMPKVTDHATPPPGALRRRRRPPRSSLTGSPSADVRAVPDSRPQIRRRMARHHGARIESHRGVPRVDTGRPRRLVSLFRPQGSRATSSIRPGADAPGSTRSVIHGGSGHRHPAMANAEPSLIPGFGGSPTTAPGPPGSGISCRRTRRS